MLYKNKDKINSEKFSDLATLPIKAKKKFFVYRTV